jgi:aminopeptidase
MHSALEKMAKILVHYSLGVKKSDQVWLTGDMGAFPLFQALYKELIMAGAHVFSTFQSQEWEEIFYRYASDEQLCHLNPALNFLTDTVNKRVRIIGPTNTRVLSPVDPAKQALASKARAPLLAKTMERSHKGDLDWVVTLCPTQALAQEASMGFEQYAEFVYKAAFLHFDDPVAEWKRQEKEQAVMIDFLTKKSELHFKTSAGTDLKVNVNGMHWRNSCGHRNFPDGEVFTGPNLKASDGGINGVVRYTYPAILNNTIVEDVTLEFHKGRLVNATAKKNEAFLKAMVNQDEGASTLGEIAIGTNWQIDSFSQNILFDEKIGGTFHAALGAGYPETGNTNKSALHWDMICDLREGGEIYADGELISKNGQFTHSGWPKSR